jgi:hypothetical protein
MTIKKKAQGAAKGKADTEELDALAHHIAETLRIMRDSEHIPARIYNDFADAWNELVNVAMSTAFLESETYTRLVLAELVSKGGAK